MKKVILIAFAASLITTSCKKDRVCSCKSVVDTTNGTTKIGTVVTDYDYTITESTRRTAYNHCTHTKWTETNGNITMVYDLNCSLK